MATDSHFSMRNIMRQQEASMIAISESAHITPCTQDPQSIPHGEGCTTWVQKWDHHNFEEKDTIFVKHNDHTHTYEATVATLNEDVVQLVLDTHLNRGTYNLLYIPNMLCHRWTLSILQESPRPTTFLHTLYSGDQNASQAPIPHELQTAVSADLYVEPSQTACFLTTMASKYSRTHGAARCGQWHMALASMQARSLAGQSNLITRPTNAVVENLLNSWQCFTWFTVPCVVPFYSSIMRATGKARPEFCAHRIPKHTGQTLR